MTRAPRTGITKTMRAPVTTPCSTAAGTAPGTPICFHCPARMSDLCAGVPDDELKLLAAISTHLHLAPGETLILDGDASDHVYNVVDGTLMMTRLGADGRRQILAFLLAGSFIGFSSDQLYRFNVEAISGSELCRFERKKLEPMFEAYPEMEQRFRQMAARVIEDPRSTWCSRWAGAMPPSAWPPSFCICATCSAPRWPSCRDPTTPGRSR